MFVLSNSLRALESKLQKKKEQTIDLKRKLRSEAELKRIKDEEISLLMMQLRDLKGKVASSQEELESARNEFGIAKAELDIAKARLVVLERKERLYPLKKRKIYQDAVDTATLAERDRMKKLFAAGKREWSPPMSDSSDSDSDQSSSDYIDSGRDSELEAELDTSNTEKAGVEPEVPRRADELDEDVNVDVENP